VSARVRKAKDAVPDSWRIPAKEIEKIAREQAIGMLRDKRLLAGWIEEYVSADLIETGIVQATNLSDILSEQQASNCQRAVLFLMFRAIALSQTSIRFEVKGNEIVHALVGDNSSLNIDVDHVESNPDGIMVIELPIGLRRRGNGMRIVIDSPYIQPEPDRSLVDLIARAHIYLDRMTSPDAMSVGSIASTFDVDRADVGRILPLAFLSPNMLDAILAGTQPASLSARHLARTELPVLWAEQNAALQ
jgi:hypothetical protein